jgi:hypothetical protein
MARSALDAGQRSLETSKLALTGEQEGSLGAAPTVPAAVTQA